MDSIIEMLKKIKRLAEQGVEGERIVAENKLRALMKKYNVDADALLDKTEAKEVYFFTKSKQESEVLVQIVGTVTPGSRIAYRQSKDQKILVFTLTPLQEADVKAQHEHFKAQLRAEWRKLLKSIRQQKKNFVTAFIAANNIYSKDATGSGESKLTEEELLAIMRQMREMERNPWMRQRAALNERTE